MTPEELEALRNNLVQGAEAPVAPVSGATFQDALSEAAAAPLPAQAAETAPLAPPEDGRTAGQLLQDALSLGADVLRGRDPLEVNTRSGFDPSTGITAAEDVGGRPDELDLHGGFNPEQVPIAGEVLPHIPPSPLMAGRSPQGRGTDVRVEAQHQIQTPLFPEEAAALARITQTRQADLLNGMAAELDQAGANADLLEDYADLVEDDPMAAERAFNGMRRQRDRMMAEIDDTLRTVASTRVDPDRFFHSRSTAAGLGAALSIAAGAAASTLVGGPNMAMQIIDRAIDRDIRAQQFDLQNQRSGAAARVGILDRLRSTFREDQGAVAALRAMHIRSAQARLAALSARENVDVRRAAIDNLIATLGDREVAAQAEMRRSATRILVRGNIRNERDRRAFSAAQVRGQGIANQDVPSNMFNHPEEPLGRSAGTRRPRNPLGAGDVRGNGRRGVGASSGNPAEALENVDIPANSAAAEDGGVNAGNVVVLRESALPAMMFHLQPLSRLRVAEGLNPRNASTARGEFRRAVVQAGQANQALRFAATQIRQHGFPDRLEQFSDEQRTELNALMEQGVRRFMEMRGVQAAARSITQGEAERFIGEAGAPGTIEQVLERFIPGSGPTREIARRLEVAATDAVDAIEAVAAEYGAMVTPSQLARMRRAAVGRGR